MVKSINLGGGASRTRRPRPEDLPPWRPSKTTRHILEYLYRYRYLTSELLAFVYHHDQGRGAYQVRNELTRLWRYGFIERFHRPTDVGSRQYVYTLSIKGAKELTAREDWRHERHKVYNLTEPKSIGYEHSLAVAVVHLLWDLGSRGQKSLFTTISAWQDKEGSRERTKNQFKARVGNREVSIQPDFTVLIGHRKRGYYRPYFFEVERTHKNSERRRRRLLAYGDLLSAVGQKRVDDVFERELDIRPERGMVIYVGADEAHASRLREFALTLVRPDTEIWFTSLDKIFNLESRRRRDGSLRKTKSGKTVYLEKPIEPAEFFERDILFNLDGKRGCLVV